MRAILVDRYGGPEVLKVAEVADPVAGPQQVVVVSLGDGADRRWLGKQVMALTAEAGPQGGYAERAIVSESGLVAVPGDPGLLRQGLSLLHDGPTALTLARNAAIRPGERVLVTGAAGGLGILLVQLAIAAGGHVVAAARGERKLELLRSLGAEAVDYSAPQWTQIVRRETGGTGPDVILDGVGGQQHRVSRHAGKDAAPALMRAAVRRVTSASVRCRATSAAAMLARR